MDIEVLSTIILAVSAIILYYDIVKFFRKSKFPYFIGRPKKALMLFLALEMIAAIAIIVVELIPFILNLDGRIFGIVAGMAEEPGKILPVIYLARKNKFFKEYLKEGGWFYVGLLAGLGFGIFEGVLYSIGIIATATSIEDALASILLGRLTVIGLHVTFTVIATWGYSRLLNGSRLGLVLGLGGATIMHSTYDFLVYSSYITGLTLHVLLASLIYPIALTFYFILKRGVANFYTGGNLSWLFRVFIINS